MNISGDTKKKEHLSPKKTKQFLVCFLHIKVTSWIKFFKKYLTACFIE